MLFLFYIFQFSWGIIQNIYSLFIFVININKKHYLYHGAIVTEWEKNYSQGIGCFIFLDSKSDEKVLVHEYGHTIQSLIMGPLFLPLIAIPSGIWCFSKIFINFRKRKHLSYYSFYTEKWANHLGTKITGIKTIE